MKGGDDIQERKVDGFLKEIKFADDSEWSPVRAHVKIVMFLRF